MRLAAMRPLRASLLLASLALISACGGSDNNASSQLSVNAGAAQTANVGGDVMLNGSGTSPSGTLSYQWTQLGTPVVSLSNANQATALFYADPSLLGVSGCPRQLVFRLTVNNGTTSLFADTTVTLSPSDPNAPCQPDTLSVSGQFSYDRIPASASGALNYAGIISAPVRGATVELVDASGVVLGSGQTNSSGSYSIGAAVVSLSVRSVQLRALAQLVSTPSWNVAVLDNTQNNAMYSLVSPMTAVVVTTGSGAVALTLDLHAGSGWDGTAYTGVRAAAPFAILDTLYGGMQSLVTAISGLAITPFTVRWSASNSSVFGDATAGEVGGTYYVDNQITLLGSPLEDTDEYDAPVILHEFGHHFEGTVSRSDSIGGEHGSSDRLDMTVAFGEGVATALSAMMSGETIYFDSSIPSSGFSFSVETISGANSAVEGWFNEDSVIYIIYDLFDAQDEVGLDTVTLGLAPLYDVLVNEHRTGIPYNSIFTFITALKAKQPSQAAAIDTLVSDQNINSVAIDAYGSNETNSAGSTDVLPVYTVLTPSSSGTTTTACISTAFGSYNKLSNRRFFRIDTVAGATYNIQTQLSSGGPLPSGTSSVLLLSQTGSFNCTLSSFGGGSCGRLNNGTFSFESSAGGTHVMELYESPERAQGTGNTCYAVTASGP